MSVLYRAAPTIGRQGLPAQKGYALVEAVLAVPLLAGLWLAVAHVGNLFHDAGRAADMSRQQAFLAAARVDPLRPASVRPGESQPRFRMQARRLAAATLADTRGLGRDHVQALRRQWLAHEPGLLRAQASVAARRPSRLGPQWNMPAPTLRRYTVIATGAAHSSSDTQAQERIGLSATGWLDAADLSRRHGERVAKSLSRVDRPWRRPAPTFDWLRPWHGVVPEQLLYRRGKRGQ